MKRIKITIEAIGDTTEEAVFQAATALLLMKTNGTNAETKGPGDGHATGKWERVEEGDCGCMVKIPQTSPQESPRETFGNFSP